MKNPVPESEPTPAQVLESDQAWIAAHQDEVLWIGNYLLENGPTNEHVLVVEAMSEKYHWEDRMNLLADIMTTLVVMHRGDKLWRAYLGIHPCSGMACHHFGIVGVHPLNTEISREAGN